MRTLATFRKKLCNTRFIRQDLRRGVVDSKMLLFYRSQIGQCSMYVHTYVCMYVVTVVHYMSLYMKSSYTSIHIHMYLLHVPATCSTVPGTCSTSDTGKKLQARFELPVYF